MRIKSVLLAIVLICTLAGCGSEGEHSQTASQSQSVSEVINETISQQTDTTEPEDNTPEKETSLAEPAEPEAEDPLPGDYDVDLLVLGSNMVYAEVSAMMMHPEDYLGKSVRMQGAFAMAEGQNRNYYACFISDAAACCSQGIEFVLEGEDTYPEGYPELGQTVTVVGTFDTYYEGETLYCQLIHAEMAF